MASKTRPCCGTQGYGELTFKSVFYIISGYSIMKHLQCGFVKVKIILFKSCFYWGAMKLICQQEIEYLWYVYDLSLLNLPLLYLERSNTSSLRCAESAALLWQNAKCFSLSCSGSRLVSWSFWWSQIEIFRTF